MTPQSSPESGEAPVQLIRNEPVQARSTARLTALLDAAAAVVDRIGYERLTTAMVAEGADASIGTVYRYFPDRIAVLQALAQRNVERLLARFDQALAGNGHGTWPEALEVVFLAFVAMFRDERGFASLRVGDVLDLRPVTTERTGYDQVADEILDRIEFRYGIRLDEDARFDFRSGVVTVDALVTRAFLADGVGEQRFLDQARRMMTFVMQPHVGATGG